MGTFKTAVTALLAAAVFAAPMSSAAADDAAATLTVTGQGTISRAPDLAAVTVTIVTNDGSAGHALSENNRRYAALVSKLGTIGIAGNDITSTSLQSYFNPRPVSAATIEPGQLYGFVVTRAVGINVTALGQTGAVIDAATGAGATGIGGVSYGFRDRRAVERAALAAAVSDAFAQAQAIAAAAHLQIVRVLRIGNGGAPGPIVPMAMMKMARTAEAPAPTTITPSNLDVENTITVTYVIR